MLEPGANVGGVKSDDYRPKETAANIPSLPAIEIAVMDWVKEEGRTINMVKDPVERVRAIRALFVEMSRVMRLDNNYVSSIFDNTVSVLEETCVAMKVLSPNEDGTPSLAERNLAYGSAVTQWLNQLEGSTGIIGCAEKELNLLGMLLGELRNKFQSPFSNRVFDRMHDTVYEANHLLTKHGFLVDEPHMFSGFNESDKTLAINPTWMDWIVKRMEGQPETFIVNTIKTAVLEEIKTHVLTPELFDSYHIEIRPFVTSRTGKVELKRKDTDLNSVIKSYIFKGKQ